MPAGGFARRRSRNLVCDNADGRNMRLLAFRFPVSSWRVKRSHPVRRRRLSDTGFCALRWIASLPLAMTCKTWARTRRENGKLLRASIFPSPREAVGYSYHPQNRPLRRRRLSGGSCCLVPGGSSDCCCYALCKKSAAVVPRLSRTNQKRTICNGRRRCRLGSATSSTFHATINACALLTLQPVRGDCYASGW